MYLGSCKLEVKCNFTSLSNSIVRENMAKIKQDLCLHACNSSYIGTIVML